jgi:hypothetical protein
MTQTLDIAPETAPTAAPVEERRRHQRRPARASVQLVRESDALRKGIPATLVDVSVSGVGLTSHVPFTAGERVSVRLVNEIQRYCREIRGVIRWTSEIEQGTYRLGIELGTRLSPLDLMGMAALSGSSASHSDSKWM